MTFNFLDYHTPLGLPQGWSYQDCDVTGDRDIWEGSVLQGGSKMFIDVLPLTSSACSHIGGLVHAPSDCGIPENIVE